MRILTTQRLILRTAALDDAPFYLELLNSRSFIEQLGDRGVRSIAQARLALADGPMLMQATRGHSIYMVTRHDGTPLGMCGLIKRAALEEIDLGYAFLPQWHGYGYACEAARAVLRYAHNSLALRRVLAIVSPGNERSVSLLQKLGFEFVKMVRLSPSDSGTPPGIRLYQHQL
jgi:RimJ/RimL family protein N-acetyltransferase